MQGRRLVGDGRRAQGKQRTRVVKKKGSGVGKRGDGGVVKRISQMEQQIQAGSHTKMAGAGGGWATPPGVSSIPQQYTPSYRFDPKFQSSSRSTTPPGFDRPSELSCSMSASVWSKGVMRMPELRVYLTVPVREILQWVTEVLVRCGDNETVREVVVQQVTGSAAPFMKKIVRGQDQSQPLMQQILRGVYGEDWRREVRREWRKMSGGSVREIWEEIELVGDILGKLGRDRRERFFDLIPEAVLDQLLWDFEYETLVEVRGLDWSRVVRKSELLMKAARSGRAVGGGIRIGPLLGDHQDTETEDK